MKNMTRLLIPLLMGASVLSAQTVSTDPVGYRTDTINAGNVAFAPTFVNANSAVSSISGLSENGGNTTISLSNASLSVGAYDESSAFSLYYIEITSGANEGYVFDIISNTASDVVVEGNLSTDFGISNESVAIRKHLTIKDIFAGSESALAAYSDSVKFFNDDGSTTVYYWIGTSWSSDFFTNHDDKPVYPGNGFIATFGSNVELTVSGTVKTTATKVPVYAGLINFIASMQPSDTDVGSLNGVAAFAAYSDSMKKFSSDGSLTPGKTYYSIGTSMSSDFFTNEDSDAVDGASAMLVAVGSDMYMTLPAAYNQ